MNKYMSTFDMVTGQYAISTTNRFVRRHLNGCNRQILSCTSLKFLAIAMAIPKNFASYKIKFAAISHHQLPPNKSNQ